MSKLAFDEKELNVAFELPNFANPGGPGIPVYSFPIKPMDAMKQAFNHNAQWMSAGTDVGFFCPKVIPDHIARGFVFEAEMIPPEQYGGKDMFGIEWEYVPVVGGSMVRPGKPFLTDANEWYEKLVWPDIDSWDWDASGRANYDYLHNGNANFCWLLNGAWYERLVSFMEFENAVVALIDEDQQDAVKDLFDRTTDLYIKIVDRCIEAYGDGIIGFTVHDDWGSQRAPFFSEATGAEMIVPYMRRLTDHIKEKGYVAELHSCGSLEQQVPNFIKAGWQAWTPMAMNDTEMLYEKYGDQIMIAVIDKSPLPDTPEGQRAAAEAFVKKNFSPKKPSTYSYMYGADHLTDAYREGLYKASRLAV